MRDEADLGQCNPNFFGRNDEEIPHWNCYGEYEYKIKRPTTVM